ncbi:uncharacterized protein VICG_02015 [Vittaforma corneae ATCC 50505]|uniref:Uncharacterized protein n=1 Tax=Vittaforma corneae (strain ATCC 50505) TaxID=993615 RepID=L2GJ88_VITCO|nr:uncharacterized protein VICG_02015 [Vittaforma corneae ATCC 50505]ELA40926.1 hypothetical protein VICG_02015 [Vittaforma corneae ATCC 50505]
MLFWIIIAFMSLATGAKNISLYNQTRGCLDSNKTYIINIHPHIQNEVRDAIVSLASKLGGLTIDEIQGVAGEKAAVTAIRSYLGTIIEELNTDLENFNIQVNLVFEKQEIDQISANGAYDPSCELTPPVVERTQNAFSSLTSKLNNTVGFHLYIYGCIYKNPKFDLINVIQNSNCGRVIGIMWEGSDNSKVLIKSAIIEAITGAKDAYANGYLTLADKNILCGFFEKCIGMSPTVHGQLLNFKKVIKYTRDNPSEIHDLPRRHRHHA